MAGAKKGKLPGITRHAFALRARARGLMDLLIPLPCCDLLEQTGSCEPLECPSLDGKDPLCRTRRILAEKLAAAMLLNRYDELHPEYDRLPAPVKDLLLKVRRTRTQGDPDPSQWVRRQRESPDKARKTK